MQSIIVVDFEKMMKNYLGLKAGRGLVCIVGKGKLIYKRLAFILGFGSFKNFILSNLFSWNILR